MKRHEGDKSKVRSTRPVSRIEITITSVPSLLTNQHIALESEMCVNVHVISVKMQS